MGKEQVMDYVMNSPENTNPAILGNMLDSMGSGSSGSESNINLIHLTREYDDEGYSTDYLTADKTYAEMVGEHATNICIAIDNTILPLHVHNNSVYSFWIDSSDGSNTIFVHKVSASRTSTEWTEQSIVITSK